MYNSVEFDMIIAREKQHDLLHQVEQDRLFCLARVGRETRVKADRRAWDRLTCWLCQLHLAGAPIVAPALMPPTSTCTMRSLGGQERSE